MDETKYLENLEIWLEFFATQLSELERVNYDGQCGCSFCREIRERYLIYKEQKDKK